MRDTGRWAAGWDPGMNEAAFAAVSTTGKVICGLIRNPYKCSGPVKHWEKLVTMLHHTEVVMDDIAPQLPPLSAWVVEGQFCQRRGNPEHIVRLGWTAAQAYTLGRKLNTERLIALPQVWTQGRPKELRLPELQEGLEPELEWTWLTKPAPPSLLNHVYDAIGMAVWGLAQTMETADEST